jgi:4-hydroxy-3-polyprenylbenzoate decarboxylase
MICGLRDEASDQASLKSQILPIYGEADFCLVGTVDPERRLPEGPFGDHLGYYSLQHDFPVLQINHVYHRSEAIWPFTVVGRPPQEDTIFGQLIHELTGPIIPTVIPGVKAVHAVDAAGVHPLLLAVGSERYTPYNPLRRPQELLTQANAILGQGQLSLAKYLLIAAEEEGSRIDIHDIAGFFAHVLRRADWRRDLHFQTKTTIDTLDYSGDAINEGSKLVIAAAGPPIRELPTQVPTGISLPSGFEELTLCGPGILAVRGPRCTVQDAGTDPLIEQFCQQMAGSEGLGSFPLIAIVDDSAFPAARFDNLLWVVFTRSDPAADVYGVDSFVDKKHWGCRGPLVIDARIKPRHAPPVREDPEISRKIDAMASRGGPLATYL